MAPFGQDASLTAGGSARFGGWNDQNLRPFSMSISYLTTLAGPSRGSGGAEGDPLLEVGDHLVGEFLLGRHLQLIFGLLDGLDEQALLGVAGDEGRAVVAALAEPFAGVQGQAAANLLGALGVAAVALADQHGADVLLEEGELFRRRLAGLGRGLGVQFGRGGTPARQQDAAEKHEA